MAAQFAYKFSSNSCRTGGPAYLNVLHKLPKKSLWVSCLFKPPWVREELLSTGPLHADEVAAFVTLLRTCAINKNLRTGVQLHDSISRNGLLEQCSDALVTMYAKCGSLTTAKILFDTHPSRDLITWNALIAGFSLKGQDQNALHYFERMQHMGLPPNPMTFSSVLKACGSLQAIDRGEQIYNDIYEQGLLTNDIKLGNGVVSMYAKCGALTKARQVLEELPARDVISCNALISGYIEQGKHEQALNCFKDMQHEGMRPSAVTFISILKACGNLRALDRGEKIHDEIAKQGLLGKKVALEVALVDMYAKCGDFAKARSVLRELTNQNVMAWNALIAGYVQHHDAEQALKCNEEMESEGISPTSVTFICILKACSLLGAPDKGEEIHDKIAKEGLLNKDIVLANALVDMYAKCGAFAKARGVIEKLPNRNIITWNALIAGYAQHGEGEQALNSFERMQREGLHPNALTFICILKACSGVQAADKGEQIHDEIAKQGLLGSNVLLGTALVDMYAKCGALAKAQQVLEELPVRDVTAWSALIAGYVQQGKSDQAFTCFEKMQREGLCPNGVTFICMLKACGSIGAADMGEKIHDEITNLGLLEKHTALGNALVDMYVKCGALVRAQRVLEELPNRNVISWSTLIAGYAQQGKGERALTCFEQMKREGLCPNAVTLICILKACGTIGAVDKGEKLHNVIAKQGLLGNDTVLGTALVGMYAKCGAFAKARQVLEELPVRNVISWNALMAGSVQKGGAEQALSCFEQMRCEGLIPDAATFSCLLSACSRSGLLEDAQTYFGSMITKYGMKPDLWHYTCMVDLFGRAGHLGKAAEIIRNVTSFDKVVWCALLSACLKWGNVEVGRWAFEHAVQVDENDATVYILMAKIYKVAGLQEDAEHIEAMEKENTARKKSAQSWWLNTREKISVHSLVGV